MVVLDFCLGMPGQVPMTRQKRPESQRPESRRFSLSPNRTLRNKGPIKPQSTTVGAVSEAASSGEKSTTTRPLSETVTR